MPLFLIYIYIYLLDRKSDLFSRLTFHFIGKVIQVFFFKFIEKLQFITNHV